MKKMKIFAKFWQNILTHVVNISLKIWKFEGESPQNIEFDQQKHYSFSPLSRIQNTLLSDCQEKDRIFWRWSLQMLLGWCCKCSHIFSAWPVTVSNPRPPVPPAYTSPGLHLHFLLQIPRNQTGGPHLLWCHQMENLLCNSCIFFIFHVLLYAL